MREQGTVARIVLVTLMVYSMLSFASARRERDRMREYRDAVCASLTRLREENDRQEDKLRSGLSDEEIMALARDRLGLVLPGEKIFYFTDREG